MYEASVNFSQAKATASTTNSPSSSKLVHSKQSFSNTDVATSLLQFSQLMNNSQLSESDLSLYSWLRCLPPQTFSSPFQRRTLRVDVEPLPKIEKILMNMSIMDSASDLLSR